jgi:Uma2 family endonuclease
MTTIILNLDTVELTDEQFYRLCQMNRDWQFERTPKGEMIIMSPVGEVSGNREAYLITDLGLWNRKTQLGRVFSSSTIFRLPNNGYRDPDVAWVRLERWSALTAEEQEKFPPICPDFVIELREAKLSRRESPPDPQRPLQEKIQEYLNSGLRLGWLINPLDEQVEIYRPSREVEIVQFPVSLSGEDVLPRFVLNLPMI